MLGRIKEILNMRIGPGEDPAKLRKRRQTAAAVLLFAVARADRVQDAREDVAMRNALQRSFGLSNEELEGLLAVAAGEVAESTSVYGFTRLINDELTDADKLELIRDMWRVAFSDGNLHKYEEHLIRKIAVLIYVPHSEFIRTKLQIAAEFGLD